MKVSEAKKVLEVLDDDMEVTLSFDTSVQKSIPHVFKQPSFVPYHDTYPNTIWYSTSTDTKH